MNEHRLWGRVSFPTLESEAYDMKRSNASRFEMDPQETLKRIRYLVKVHKHVDGLLQHDADTLVELIDALDLWISKGGGLPKEWSQAYVRALAEKEV